MRLENDDNMEYEGTFLKFRMHGVGRLIKNGIVIYEGFFQHGLYHGLGIEYFNNSKIHFLNNPFFFFFGLNLEQSFGSFFKGMKNGIRIVTDILEES